MCRSIAAADSRKLSLQRVTQGHQNQPFCIGEVLVGKLQLVSHSEHCGKADVGDVGGDVRRAEWAAGSRKPLRDEW